ncbi:MAG: glycine cleavage system protein T, partial [Alphaproteobacteria bacterium]|nr:glycine cleavage system protein T [Alphaproteobacteria bacterium]
VIRRQLAEGTARLRVGIRPDGRQPAREGSEIRDAAGAVVGQLTSGGFGPSVGGPIAMGYVARPLARPGTALELMVRGKALPAKVAPLPFIAKRYAK